MQQMTIDGFDALLNVLPYWMRGLVEEHAERLEEICLDRGKPLCFKFTEGFKVFERLVDQDDLEQVMCEVGVARSDGRTGIDSTLHRVATVTNRYGAVTGYTIRVGRYIQGVAEPLRGAFSRYGCVACPLRSAQLGQEHPHSRGNPDARRDGRTEALRGGCLQ